ncbi:MAG: alcohol dehydrogenase catalytic domain-containing protein [Burkholderiales bacterium]
MKALVYQGERTLRLQDVAEPVLEVDDVLVRVAAVGVCGSDMGLIRGEIPAAQTPLILGHEFGGWLDDGQFVVVNPMLSCGTCTRCQVGNTHLCAKLRVLGFRRSGAYAERVAVPRRNLVPAPGLSPLQSALVEPVANGVHAWHRAGRPTGSVAIIGAGSIGMCLLHVLVANGVRDITVVDPMAERQAHALRDGAHHAAAELTGEYDAVFDAAGTQATRLTAACCTAPGGFVALIGLHDNKLDLSASTLIVGDRTLCGCFAYSQQEFAAAVPLTQSFNPSWLQTVPLQASEAAMQALIDGTAPRSQIKTVFQVAA